MESRDVSCVPKSRSGLRAPVAITQKSASRAPALVRSRQPMPVRLISSTRAFSMRAPARSARSSIIRFKSRREYISSGSLKCSVAALARGADRIVSVTTFLGVLFSIRNGYVWYAL